jgi:hypothetical protein
MHDEDMTKLDETFSELTAIAKTSGFDSIGHKLDVELLAAHQLVRATGGFTWGNARDREDLVSYAEQRSVTDGCGPVVHGHCDFCREKLSDKAVMVTEKWGGAVPICIACATPENIRSNTDSDHQHEVCGPRRLVTCPGCDLELSIPKTWRWRYIEACSNICYQRARREARRMKQFYCEACKTWFETSRTDARFCSNKCRQWQYRRRKAS